MVARMISYSLAVIQHRGGEVLSTFDHRTVVHGSKSIGLNLEGEEGSDTSRVSGIRKSRSGSSDCH